VRLQGWEETFVGEMGVERSFQRRKPTRWVWSWGESWKNPEMKY